MVMEQGPRLILSAEEHSLWVLDWVANEIRILMQSGEQHSGPMGADMVRPSDEIARTFFDWDRWWLSTETTKGHLVLSEVWSPVGDPVKGRPSVYLDQCHWSTLAKAVARPESVSDEDLVSARRLIKLANDGGIRLPISSATMQETAGLYGDRRYEVGIAIASLSGGWQLRDPLEIRRQEFAAWFAQRLGLERSLPAIDAVTLAPRSIYGGRVDSAAGDDMSDSMRLFNDALTWPSVLVSMLIDPDRIPSVPPNQWAEGNGRLAEYLATLPREKRTALTTWAAVQDNDGLMRSALSTLSMTDAEMNRLAARDLADAVTEPAFGGLYTAIMSERLRDPKRRWLPNDLNDIIFLACATVYCDYVAAERSTGRQISQVLSRRKEPSNVHTNLRDLVAALDRDGVKSVSEAEERCRRRDDPTTSMIIGAELGP